VKPRRRHQCRHARHELVGSEHEEERASPRALHTVDEPSGLGARKALQGEGRPDGVPSQPLQALAIALVDPDPGMEREAVEAASLPLTLTTLAIMAIGIWLLFSPFASALGFAALPHLDWPLLLATLFLYVLLTQSVKMWLLRRAWI
jgi:hypothetical protein